jgi:hypothetical protein
MERIKKTYRIYGRVKGDTISKTRYLYTTSANNAKEAVAQAKKHNEGFTITRAEAQW